jgi:pimeloyl-ACP methyl ester carboxylesterase
VRWIVLVFTLTACVAKPSAPAQRLPEDAGRTGVSGSNGPYQVVQVSWEAVVRIDETIRIDATYPIPRDETPLPVILFIQGGAVEVSRYQWLYDHLASRGYTVVVPHHALNLAVFETDNARFALDSATKLGLVPDGVKVAIMGHSLGGVIAASLFEDPRYAALAFLASYPAEGDVRQRSRPVLSIGGTSDERSTPASVKLGLLKYGAPRALTFVDGLNHYAWVDDATPSELLTDGPLIGSLAAVRADTLLRLDAWLDAVLRDDAAAAQTLEPLLEAVSLQ